MTGKELLALCASNVYSHEDQSIDSAIAIAEGIISAAEQAQAYKPEPPLADRERAGEEARKRLVRRAVPSRPAVADEELPF